MTLRVGRRAAVCRCAVCLLAGLGSAAFRVSAGEPAAAPAIGLVRSSVVAVGTFRRLRQPSFRFRGTGFAVADGTLIATNAHVLPEMIEAGTDPEFIAVVIPGRAEAQHQVRSASLLAVSPEHDLALLRIGGAALPALKLADSDQVREGQEYLFTGFPIGDALSLFPATHRAMIAAVTPIVLPAGRSTLLDARVIRQLKSGPFDVFQLDATVFPGHSGSPLYHPQSGEVVGVVNMALARVTKEAALPQPSGIAYCIPARHLAELLQIAR